MGRSNGFVGRRDFLRLTGAGLAGAIAGITWDVQPIRAETALPPDAALQKLLNGNQRFVWHHPEYPHQSAKRLQEVAFAQHPYATVLSCADSRVPAEIVFDAGIGDLFDIRVAGNIITAEVLGSLEYAAALLGTSLIMVLGHERCGAVTAAVKNEILPGSIGSLVKAIKPAINRVKDRSEDFIELAIVENVYYQIEQMQRQSSVLTQLVKSGKLKIVGGRYDLDTGLVSVVT
jgi:carbonic anhydrase